MDGEKFFNKWKIEHLSFRLTLTTLNYTRNYTPLPDFEKEEKERERKVSVTIYEISFLSKREIEWEENSHRSSSSEYSILSLMELVKLYADFFLLPLILPFSRSNLCCGIFSELP